MSSYYTPTAYAGSGAEPQHFARALCATLPPDVWWHPNRALAISSRRFPGARIPGGSRHEVQGARKR